MKLILLLSLCVLLSGCTGFQSIVMSQKINNANNINIIFIGNSITYHPQSFNKNWDGNFGMAASSEDADYVHIVSKSLNANFRAFNLSDWERTFWFYDYSELSKYKGWADIVIIKLGENVTELIDFKKSFEVLLEQIGVKNTIIASTWWPYC